MVKRFFSALLAAIMCLSLSATAFAAEPDEGLAFFEQGGVVTLNEKGKARLKSLYLLLMILVLFLLVEVLKLGVPSEGEYLLVLSLWKETTLHL